jgi:phosphohistidine swiveling domain-containing protein
MKKIDILKKELKKDWYIQGFNGYPIYLNSAAHSGLVMKKELGFGYTEFIFDYQDGHGGMWYLASDFSRIWKIIKQKLKSNPRYLEQVKKRYEKIFKQNERLFSKIENSQLTEESDLEILEMLKKCSLSATDGVGIAHILDPIGPKIEKEFKAELSKFICDGKKFNHVYAVLTTPEELSFIAQEEGNLRKIAQESKGSQKNRLERHARRYFWIQNSFAGGKRLKVAFFEKRMADLSKNKPLIKKVSEEAQRLMRRHKLDRKIKEMVNLINFSAIWQDQRKANVLKSVGYFEKVIEEVSRRSGIRKELLYYLGFTDILKAKTIVDIKFIEKELALRRKGLFVLMRYNKEQNFFGRDFMELTKYHKKLDDFKKEKIDELHGSIASQGTAIGKVVICIGIRSFSKVKKGDIVVASMTRPEYMPALKKAAAIITDEGGITSHAAIIARELGIPAVIGTKVATKVLKDGYLVEVRANYGVVKILKRK